MTVSDPEETAGRARLTLASAQAPSDEALCQAFLDGDEAAFATLVERHRKLVFSLVRRFAPRPEDAADLSQQVFLRALESSKRVFGRWLFAPAFFWEDVFSIFVLALHTAYLAAVATGFGDAWLQMQIALAAYAAYVINAAQFVLKLRAARRDAGASFRPTGARGLAR